MKNRFDRYVAVTATVVTGLFTAVAEPLTYDDANPNRLTSAVLNGESVTIPEDVTIAAGAKLS